MEEDEANSKSNTSKREVEDDLGLSMLIDSQNNQYILTKPRDSTIPRADHHFIKVIILETFLSFILVRFSPTSLMPVLLGWVEYSFSIFFLSKVTLTFMISRSTGDLANVFPTSSTVFSRLIVILHESFLGLFDLTCCTFGTPALFLDCSIKTSYCCA